MLASIAMCLDWQSGPHRGFIENGLTKEETSGSPTRDHDNR
jgi:hypothetical protein